MDKYFIRLKVVEDDINNDEEFLVEFNRRCSANEFPIVIKIDEAPDITRLTIDGMKLVDFITLLIGTVVALLSSYAVAEFFAIPEEFYYLLQLMGLTILFKAVEISTGVLRLYDRFKIQAKSLGFPRRSR